MIKKRKQSIGRKGNAGMNLGSIGTALDLMLAGHNSVISPDFLITRRDPYNADIGHLDPSDLCRFDQDFVDMLCKIKPKQQASIPEDLEGLCQKYLKQRELLSAYHEKPMEALLLSHEIEAAKELGNFDPYIKKVVIRNNAEMNIFYDYIALYKEIEGKRIIEHWRSEHPKGMNTRNKAVVAALEKATFAVLRLDKNLGHWAIKATNVITQTECILMDRALHSSRKEGWFFICSILDMGSYVMTSGGGTPISPKLDAGKSALTLLKPHLDKLQAEQQAVTPEVTECVRKVIGFCLRSGALEYMTIR